MKESISGSSFAQIVRFKIGAISLILIPLK